MSPLKKEKLLVIGPLPPPLAGPEIVTKNIINSEIVSKEFLISHINTTVRKSNSDKGTISIFVVLKIINYFLVLIKNIIFNRPSNVLYLPTSATLLGWIRDGGTIFICMVFNVKTIVLFQGGHFRYFYNSLSYIPKKIIHWHINRVSIILTQAESLKKQFKGLVPPDKVEKLYNSLDETFVSKFDDYVRGEHKGINILFVGHLSIAKGYCDILKVIPEIKNKNVFFNFMGTEIENETNIFYNQLTGEKINILSQKQCYEDYIVSNKLEDQVKFLGGNVLGSDKVEAFKKADIFVSPSYSEGFSTAILEAMAAGLPLVVTKVGAAPDILEQNINAKLITPGVHDELKNSLVELITSPELCKHMGRNNRKKCKDYFMVKHSSRQLVSLLDNLNSG